MSHENEGLIRRLFELFGRGDREGAVALFAEDAVFSYPGRGTLHGEWGGRKGILDLWAQQDLRSDGDFRPQMLDLVAGDRNVFLLVRIARADGTGAWTRVVVYQISNGKIASARVFEDDPDMAEAFFSRR